MTNKMQKDSGQIPVDLLTDIFSRVPPKSIGRFRCLSKLWRSILGRAYFTDLFLTRSSTRPRLLFMFTVYGDPVKDVFSVLYSSPQPQNPDENSSVVATLNHTLSCPYFAPTPLCGIVFFTRWREEVREICNPVTGESITLPKLDRKVEKMYYMYNTFMSEHIYFGYDPVNKQYKVLCMISSPNRGLCTHWILTLETEKLLWRKIECDFHYVCHLNITRKICINGVLYFGVYFEGSSIACFDVMSESFGFIKVDDDMLLKTPDDHPVGYLTLVNYKGKLGVYQRQDQLVLWVLENAEKHKWSKHVYVLSPEEEKIVTENKFSGVTSTGELVFSPGKLLHPFYVFFYNLEKKTFTRVSIHGFEEFKGNTHSLDTFLDHVETMKLT